MAVVEGFNNGCHFSQLLGHLSKFLRQLKTVSKFEYFEAFSVSAEDKI